MEFTGWCSLWETGLRYVRLTRLRNLIAPHHYVAHVGLPMYYSTDTRLCNYRMGIHFATKSIESAAFTKSSCPNNNRQLWLDSIHIRGIDIVKRLKLINVIARRDYFVALTVFKCIRGMATNATSTNLVTLQYVSLHMFKNSFAYRGPFIWNALPNNIRKCVTLSCFKIALRISIIHLIHELSKLMY